MRIDSYTFGQLTVQGKTYTSDVIIYPESVHASWWRKEGHTLQIIDVKEALDRKPDILIIGTGYAGILSVPEAVRKSILSEGIELHVEKTGKAVELFNALQGKAVTIAALHLTC